MLIKQKSFFTRTFMHNFVLESYFDRCRTDSCYKWLKFQKKTSLIIKARVFVACVVFGERIFGGFSKNVLIKHSGTIHDRWSSMPSVDFYRFNHNLVVVENKLFAVLEKSDTC